ncbi:hypothetical protein C8A00DRAFT_18606 [Chaetomidium leptoderma]|uniref:2EXR domain-containing protein n=1 Tax=Chaetomidium leptoderma TaxID=669021 RepID=A0AAN6VE28_9PEZI|nr:hypothetical protein C8A00DRAFT_18606 [Chaetomidium leptoderma]
MFTSFHPFPRLPFELRAKIWKLAVEPRTVDVRIVDSVGLDPPATPRLVSSTPLPPLLVSSTPVPTRLVSSTPVPTPLQTCREARSLGLYQQAFPGVSQDGDRRYVWLNFEMDMISIGTSMFTYFKPLQPLIKRLEFEPQWRLLNAEGRVSYVEIDYLCDFVNVM